MAGFLSGFLRIPAPGKSSQVLKSLLELPLLLASSPDSLSQGNRTPPHSRASSRKIPIGCFPFRSQCIISDFRSGPIFLSLPLQPEGKGFHPWGFTPMFHPFQTHTGHSRLPLEAPYKLEEALPS